MPPTRCCTCTQGAGTSPRHAPSKVAPSHCRSNPIATASAPHTASRRHLLTLSVGLCTLPLLPPPHSGAYLLDEDNAAQVFNATVPSVVGIIDLRVERGGEEVLEGVGSGLIWDKYGCVVSCGIIDCVTHTVDYQACRHQLPLHFATGQGHHWHAGTLRINATLSLLYRFSSQRFPR